VANDKPDKVQSLAAAATSSMTWGVGAPATRISSKRGAEARVRWCAVASLVALDSMEGRKKKVERHFTLI
jgi:hypothetical protein